MGVEQKNFVTHLIITVQYLIIGNQRSMKLRYWKLTRLKLMRI